MSAVLFQVNKIDENNQLVNRLTAKWQSMLPNSSPSSAQIVRPKPVKLCKAAVKAKSSNAILANTLSTGNPVTAANSVEGLKSKNRVSSTSMKQDEVLSLAAPAQNLFSPSFVNGKEHKPASVAVNSTPSFMSSHLDDLYQLHETQVTLSAHHGITNSPKQMLMQQQQMVPETRQQYEVLPVTEQQHEVLPVTGQQHGALTVTKQQHGVFPVTGHHPGAIPVTGQQHRALTVTKQQHGVFPAAGQQNRALTVAGQHGALPLTRQQHGVYPVAGHEPGVIPVAGHQHGVLPVAWQQNKALTVAGQHGALPVVGHQPGVIPMTGQQHGALPVVGHQPGVIPMTGQQHGALIVTGNQPGVIPVTGQQHEDLKVTGQQNEFLPPPYPTFFHQHRVPSSHSVPTPTLASSIQHYKNLTSGNSRTMSESSFANAAQLHGLSQTNNPSYKATLMQQHRNPSAEQLCNSTPQMLATPIPQHKLQKLQPILLHQHSNSTIADFASPLSPFKTVVQQRIAIMEAESNISMPCQAASIYQHKISQTLMHQPELPGINYDNQPASIAPLNLEHAVPSMMRIGHNTLAPSCQTSTYQPSAEPILLQHLETLPMTEPIHNVLKCPPAPIMYQHKLQLSHIRQPHTLNGQNHFSHPSSSAISVQQWRDGTMIGQTQSPQTCHVTSMYQHKVSPISIKHPETSEMAGSSYINPTSFCANSAHESSPVSTHQFVASTAAEENIFVSSPPLVISTKEYKVASPKEPVDSAQPPTLVQQLAAPTPTATQFGNVQTTALAASIQHANLAAVKPSYLDLPSPREHLMQQNEYSCQAKSNFTVLPSSCNRLVPPERVPEVSILNHNDAITQLKVTEMQKSEPHVEKTKSAFMPWNLQRNVKRSLADTPTSATPKLYQKQAKMSSIEAATLNNTSFQLYKNSNDRESRGDVERFDNYTKESICTGQPHIISANSNTYFRL